VARVRLRLAVALTALLVSLPAGALAARITGTAHADRLVGTTKADTLDGLAGNDKLLGLGGNDVLRGGPGRDRLDGGAGSDSIAANGDGARDAISCGSGTDIVNADLGDSVSADCEVTSRQISTDTLTGGGGGQHATEVEPDSFAFGQTIVAVFQVGRVENGGATAIGVATSTDAGSHWRSGLLPGMTTLSPQPGTDPRASDPTVGYDAVHGVWLAASLGIASSSFQILVSRSPDGIAWSQPVAARVGPSGSLDKEWIACDNWPSSPNRGHCYLSYLNVASNLIVTQTSTDGGLSWGPSATTSIQPSAGVEPNGAQPLPRPDGSLVVVYELGGERGPSLSDAVLATTSLDGGASFQPSVQISSLSWSPTPGLRAPPLPSADVAADGRLFVSWEDCRLDPACSRDRILLSSSVDGQTWTSPTPVGPATPGSDQFVPGLAVGLTAAGGQVLAVAYNSMPQACAVRPSCPGIDVWLTRSVNGGTTWTRPQRLDAQPMRLDWLPQAEGRFFGDYISTSFVGGRAVPVYSLAVTPFGGKLRQAIMALQTG
jgi:RTX calcium-binding nonapeptide repeat (4 copies)